MKMKSMIRIAIGITLVAIGSFRQGSENGNIGNAAWAIVILSGLYLLLPLIKMISDRIFKKNDGDGAESKMFTAKLFYLGAVAGGMIALNFQEELHNKGHIFVGRGYSYSISGSDAERQVMVCWIGSAASLLIALILHARARKFTK